jgi:hypothetical protein
LCASIVVICSFFPLLPLPPPRVADALQAAAAAAAAVVENLSRARKISKTPEDTTAKREEHQDSAAWVAAESACTTEALADETSLCLTLLSRTITHAHATVHLIPADLVHSAAVLAAAAEATNALQETAVCLAGM